MLFWKADDQQRLGLVALGRDLSGGGAAIGGHAWPVRIQRGDKCVLVQPAGHEGQQETAG